MDSPDRLAVMILDREALDVDGTEEAFSGGKVVVGNSLSKTSVARSQNPRQYAKEIRRVPSSGQGVLKNLPRVDRSKQIRGSMARGRGISK